MQIWSLISISFKSILSSGWLRMLLIKIGKVNLTSDDSCNANFVNSLKQLWHTSSKLTPSRDHAGYEVSKSMYSVSYRLRCRPKFQRIPCRRYNIEIGLSERGFEWCAVVSLFCLVRKKILVLFLIILISNIIVIRFRKLQMIRCVEFNEKMWAILPTVCDTTHR